jgi:hypothetical protein
MGRGRRTHARLRGSGQDPERGRQRRRRGSRRGHLSRHGPSGHGERGGGGAHYRSCRSHRRDVGGVRGGALSAGLDPGVLPRAPRQPDRPGTRAHGGAGGAGGVGRGPGAVGDDVLRGRLCAVDRARERGFPSRRSLRTRWGQRGEISALAVVGEALSPRGARLPDGRAACPVGAGGDVPAHGSARRRSRRLARGRIRAAVDEFYRGETPSASPSFTGAKAAR